MAQDPVDPTVHDLALQDTRRESGKGPQGCRRPGKRGGHARTPPGTEGQGHERRSEEGPEREEDQGQGPTPWTCFGSAKRLHW